MIVLLDTSSLLSLVRYYLPFDGNNILLKYFEENFLVKEFIILDKVYEESKHVSGGIILEKLTILKDKKLIIKTDNLLPDQKFFRRLENEFCYSRWKKELSTPQFETRKTAYLNSADCKLLLYWLQNTDIQNPNEMIIVTEETEVDNDRKAFKKLPAICNMLQIEHKTLPELISLFDNFKINFTLLTK